MAENDGQREISFELVKIEKDTEKIYQLEKSIYRIERQIQALQSVLS